MNDESPIVFFDGVCNLCDSTVQRVIARDPDGVFKFAPLQGDTAKRLLLPDRDYNSVIVKTNDTLYERSDAVIEILRALPRRGVLFHLLRCTPRPLRDFFYQWVAQNRYRWFGRKDQCMIPNSDVIGRFLP